MNDVTRIPQGVSLRTISKSVSVLVLINIFNFPSHIRRKLWYNPHLLLLETMVNTYNFLMDYLGGNQTPTNRYTDRQTVCLSECKLYFSLFIYMFKLLVFTFFMWHNIFIFLLWQPVIFCLHLSNCPICSADICLVFILSNKIFVSIQ